ncbi:serine hydrolase [Fretibacter rubidus]|uniref:serine hydrolase n=1 Tax=Fretibacter rubidus TaxID=570162 RepID=UPI00352B8619
MWFMRFILLLCVLTLAVPTSTAAEQAVDGRYASIVVDAQTLDVIHARQIDALRYPASLTKVMTLVLTFDALDRGDITLSTRMTTSRFAAATPPGKLGLRKGQTISVEDAIKALTVRSANDVAVVLAEHIGGDVERFAAQMTAKAQSLGMSRTVFKNPHGLPHIAQVTTARDMAKLADYVLRAHAQYYPYFGLETFTYNGVTRKNTNALLPWLQGVDGFKTGYTRASGYNLIISAERGGRRIIAIVLGGATGKSRDSHMQDLIERGFDVLGVAPIVSIAPEQSQIVVRKDVPKKVVPKIATAVRLRGRNAKPVVISTGGQDLTIQSVEMDNNWAIQIGAFGTEMDARAQIDAVSALIKGGSAQVIPVSAGPRTLYRARIKGFNFEGAHSGCRALASLKSGCLVIAPTG